MAGENNAKPNDPKLPDSSGLLRMSDLGNKSPNYKSLPKNRKARNLNDNEPIMGHGSAFSSSRFNTDSERKDFANKRREGLKQGLVSSAGRALRGKRDLSHEDRELLSSGKNTVDPEKRARLEQLRRTTGVRGAVNNMKRQVYQEALRFGSDKAFYWLLGLILPTFGLAILGLDILWLLGSRLGAQLKVWQKITIVLLNLLVLGLLFVIFLASMIYFCSVTIPFGTTIAKGLGQIGAPEYVTFCKYFDIGNIAAGISGGSSTGISGGGSRINKSIGTFNGTVPTGDARSLAQQILATSRITLNNDTRGDARSGARQNILNTAEGRPAYTSVRGEGGGGQTNLDSRMLAGILAASQVSPVTVTFVAGGDHSDNSLHYDGKAFDAGLSGKWPDMLAACKAAGAREILGPGDSGHDTHIHCAW